MRVQACERLEVRVGTEETVVHGQVRLAGDVVVRDAVAEEVEREYDVAVGGVFEGYDAIRGDAILDGGEDV